MAVQDASQLQMGGLDDPEGAAGAAVSGAASSASSRAGKVWDEEANIALMDHFIANGLHALPLNKRGSGPLGTKRMRWSNVTAGMEEWLRAHPNYQLSCSANNLAQHIKALVARFKKAELATPPANEFSERLYHLMKTAVTSMDRIQDESKAEQQHTARPSSMQHRGGDQLQLGAGSSGGGAGAASPGGAAEASGSAQPSAKRARLMDGSAAASAAASEALQAATRAAHVAEREVEAATQRALSAADSGDLPQAARAFVALQRELTTLVLEQQREFLGRMEIQQRAFFAMVEAMHRASPTQAQPQAAANAAVPAPTTAVAPTHVTSVAPMTTVPPEAGAGAAAPATSRPADGAIGASSDALGASSDAIGGELAPMQTAGATGGAAEAPTLPPSTSHSA